MRKNIIKTAAILFLSTAVSYAAGNAVVIEVKTNAVVDGDSVVLKDIAVIRGKAETVELLGNASLGYSPAIGNVRSIPIRKIRLVIAAAGVPEGSFILRSPEVVYVHRSGQKVDSEHVRQKIEDTLLSAFDGSKIQVEFARLDIPDMQEVPLGNLEIDAPLTNIRNLFAPFSLQIEIRVDSKLVRRISANVEITAFADVLTAKTDIRSLETVNPAQTVFTRQKIVKPITEYITDPNDIRGIRSSREIRTGEPITKSDYVADLVVRNGERVRISGFSGRLQLSINGVALASGRIGDRIAVKNLQSNQILQAKIVDIGIVEVFF